jgi:hypothetical protein
MSPSADEVESSFNAMYAQLREIQDPNLVRRVLMELLEDHPLVASDGEGVRLEGATEEGMAFAHAFARRCEELLGTPESFFDKYFTWEQEAFKEDAPELDAIIDGITPGRSYLIKELGKSRRTYELFRRIMDRAYSGLCVSRTKPAILESEYGLGQMESRWLTDIYLTENNLINPTNVAQINIIVKDFIKHRRRGAVLLEGIEYLIYYNGNDSIIKLLFSLNENIMISESLLMVPVDPKSLDPKTLFLLEKDLEVIDFT